MRALLASSTALALALLSASGCTATPGAASGPAPGEQPLAECRPVNAYVDLEAMAADFAGAPSIMGLRGGDIAVTTRLPSGERTSTDLLMAFGDPILDTDSVSVPRPQQATGRHTTVRNALLAFATDRACLVLGPRGSAFVPDRVDGVGYWPTSFASGADGSTAMFLQRVAETDDSGFVNLGPSIAELRSTDDGLPFVEDVSDIGVDDASRQRIGWGAASWPGDDGYVYVFGTANPERDLVFGWSLHVARTTPEGIFDVASWEYWSGAGWTADEEDATPVIPAVGGVDQTLSVFAEEGTWYAVSKRDGYLGEEVVIWSAPAPTGPWAAAEVVALRPSHPEAGIVRYAALAHPALFPKPGTIVLSVSNNSTDPDAIAADPTLYRPEFLRVPLP